jgi:spore coat polysaccharide biosynthesis predicted glycosyltransferase SpsG
VTVAIITDGGLELGMGHVYRAINLAKELPKGTNIHFITTSDAVVCEKIARSGFKVTALASDDGIIDFLGTLQTVTVVIDRLKVEEEFAKKLKAATGSRLILFGNRTGANRYADVVVNSVVEANFTNNTYVDEKTHTLFLCGPKYLVLRQEFYDVKRKKVRPKVVNKILLVFGGSDPSDLTSNVLDQLLSYRENWRIDVLLGPQYCHFGSLKNVLKRHPGCVENVSICYDALNVAQFMSEADLVITSPGLSMFEAFCVKTPALLIYQNDLQKSEFKGHLHIYDRTVIRDLKQLICSWEELNKNDAALGDLQTGSGKNEIVDLVLGKPDVHNSQSACLSGG